MEVESRQEVIDVAEVRDAESPGYCPVHSGVYRKRERAIAVHVVR